MRGCWLVVIAACGYPQPERLPDADTSGWPTDGGVVAPPCTSPYDEDGDGQADDCDNCPLDDNDQADADRDGIGDVCDPHPEYAVERLVYFTGFNDTVAAEGYKVGTPGIFVVESSLLKQSGGTVARTLFMISGGPWRRPTVELKIASLRPNGTVSDFYAGVYILQELAPAVPDPRPDSLGCIVAYGSDPRFRLTRFRGSGTEVANATLPFAVATGVTVGLAAARLGEPPSLYGAPADIAPAQIEPRTTILSDDSDVEMSKIGVWTNNGQADFSGLAVYEATYPP
jgi:hypothetical protein